MSLVSCVTVPGLVPGVVVSVGCVNRKRDFPHPTEPAMKYRDLLLLILVVALCSPAAQAQDAVAAFYKGKQISLIVGSSAGGGYDTYARLLGRHLGKYIPG